MDDQFRLDGRVALICGAGGGIGSAIARGMASAGAAIAGLDHDTDALGATMRELDTGSSLGIEADVTDQQDIIRACDRVEAELAPVDILVNTVFVARNGAPETLTLADWRLNLDINLSSYFICAQEVGRRMIARGAGGSIINISSIAGTSAVGRRSLPYSVCKAGINLLTKELAVEWAKYGIRVNAIQPCQIMTPGLKKRMEAHPFDEDTMSRILGGIPMNRFGEPAEVAGPAVFLASPAASLVTGALLAVDGGNLAMNAGGSHTYH
jgi:NAD(P)-dependent dehydrogenase (short-subunit alcohol dehydrogenase family)